MSDEQQGIGTVENPGRSQLLEETLALAMDAEPPAKELLDITEASATEFAEIMEQSDRATQQDQDFFEEMFNAEPIPLTEKGHEEVPQIVQVTPEDQAKRAFDLFRETTRHEILQGAREQQEQGIRMSIGIALDWARNSGQPITMLTERKRAFRIEYQQDEEGYLPHFIIEDRYPFLPPEAGQPLPQRNTPLGSRFTGLHDAREVTEEQLFTELYLDARDETNRMGEMKQAEQVIKFPAGYISMSTLVNPVTEAEKAQVFYQWHSFGGDAPQPMTAEEVIKRLTVMGIGVPLTKNDSIQPQRKLKDYLTTDKSPTDPRIPQILSARRYGLDTGFLYAQGFSMDQVAAFSEMVVDMVPHIDNARINGIYDHITPMDPPGLIYVYGRCYQSRLTTEQIDAIYTGNTDRVFSPDKVDLLRQSFVRLNMNYNDTGKEVPKSLTDWLVKQARVMDEDKFEKLTDYIGVISTKKLQAIATQTNRNGYSLQQMGELLDYAATGYLGNGVKSIETFFDRKQEIFEALQGQARFVQTNGREGGRASFENMDLSGMDFSQNGPFSGYTEYLAGISFADANLDGASFEGVDISGVNMQGAIVRGTNFKDAVLTRANLEGAVISGAEFKNTDLRGADFQNANIGQATHSGIIGRTESVEPTTFEGCMIDGANFKNATIRCDFRDVTTKATPEGHQEYGFGADFTNATLNGSTFKGCVLNDTHFNGAGMENCTFRGAEMRYCDFSEAHMAGASIEQMYKHNSSQQMDSRVLTSAQKEYIESDLTCSKFTGTDLSNAQFTHSNLEFCSFTNATMKNAVFMYSNMQDVAFQSPIQNTMIGPSNLNRDTMNFGNDQKVSQRKSRLLHAEENGKQSALRTKVSAMMEKREAKNMERAAEKSNGIRPSNGAR